MSFPATASGQMQKNSKLAQLLSDGWEVVSETVSSGDYNVDAAVTEGTFLCCLCGPLCAPLGLLGKKNTGVIAVTLKRTAAEKLKAEDAQRERQAEQDKREREDYKRSNVTTLVRDYMAKFPGKYLSPKIVQAARDYIANHRSLDGPIPSLERSSREGGGVVLRVSSDVILSTYTLAQLARLPDEVVQSQEGEDL